MDGGHLIIPTLLMWEKLSAAGSDLFMILLYSSAELLFKYWYKQQNGQNKACRLQIIDNIAGRATNPILFLRKLSWSDI